MTQPYNYCSEFDVTIFGRDLIIVIKNVKKTASSNRDYRISTDPEECFGLVEYDYDILDQKRNLANHLKEKLTLATEEDLNWKIQDHINMDEPNYIYNRIPEESYYV